MISDLETILEHMVGPHRTAIYSRAMKVLEKHGEDSAMNELVTTLQGDDHVPTGMLQDAVDNIILTGFRLVHQQQGISAEGTVQQMTELSDGLFLLQHFDLPEPILAICSNEDNPSKDKLCELLELMTTLHYTEFAEVIHFVSDTLINRIQDIYTPKTADNEYVPHDRENLNMVKALGAKYQDCLIHRILSHDQFRINTPSELLCKEYTMFFHEDAISIEEKALGIISIALVSGCRKINIEGVAMDVAEYFYTDVISVSGLQRRMTEIIKELNDA